MRKSMDRICQHCGELILGNAYRVTSEEEGISLLDMVVCSLCFMEAKRLHLYAEEISKKTTQPLTRTRKGATSYIWLSRVTSSKTLTLVGFRHGICLQTGLIKDNFNVYSFRET